MRFLLILLITLSLFSCRKKEFEDQVIPKETVELDILEVEYIRDIDTFKIDQNGYFYLKVKPNDIYGDDIFFSKNPIYKIEYIDDVGEIKYLDESQLNVEIDVKSQIFRFDSIYRFKFYPKSIGKKSFRISFSSNGKSTIRSYNFYVHALETQTEMFWLSKYALDIDPVTDNNHIVKNLKSLPPICQGDLYNMNSIYLLNKNLNSTGNYYSIYQISDKNVVHVTWPVFKTETINEKYYFNYKLGSGLGSDKLKLLWKNNDIQGYNIPTTYIYEPNYENGFTFDIQVANDHPISQYNGVLKSGDPFYIYVDIKNSKDVVVQQDTLTYYVMDKLFYNTYTISISDFDFDLNGNGSPLGQISTRYMWTKNNSISGLDDELKNSALNLATINCINAPSNPGSITGEGGVCPPNNLYSVSPQSNVEYIWNFDGTEKSIITNLDGSCIIDFGSSSGYGNVSVYTKNFCGVSTVSNISVNVIPVATQPSIISGPPSITKDNYINYDVSLNPPPITYDWSYSGDGATIFGDGSNSIQVYFASNATSGVLSVIAQNGCGNSIPRSINITVQ